MHYYSFIAFGVIGAIDDSLKIVHKKNEGLKSYRKMLLLLIVSGILAYYATQDKNIGTAIIIPFVNQTWELGKWYIPFIILFFLCTTNGVNLTDGLDGLATSITLLVMTFFALISLAIGNYQIALFCGIVAGAPLGFLRYNTFPAQVFMGDTGSLALGGLVGAIAIYKVAINSTIDWRNLFIEVLSVVIQVVSFKLTGKRVFKMSPIHHHFELSGWHETRVVAIFSIVTVVLCLIAFLSLSVIY